MQFHLILRLNFLFYLFFCFIPLFAELPPPLSSPSSDNSPLAPESLALETLPLESRVVDLNGIAAIVEDHIITHNEIYQEMLPLLKQVQYESLNAEDYEQRLKSIEADVLQSLIDRVLIVKEFEKQGFQIPDPVFEAEFNHHVEGTFGNDRTLFLHYLKSQGKDLKQFRKEFKEKLIVSAMRAKKQSSQAEISPEKIESYYEQHTVDFQQEEQLHLLQVLLSAENDESLSAVEAKANAILARTKSEPFESFYQDYGQASDLGWVSKGDLLSDLAEKVFVLHTGDCSQPIILNNTVFVFYVLNSKPAGLKPLDEVREEIELILSTQLMRQNIEKWLKGLRKRAYIKVY